MDDPLLPNTPLEGPPQLTNCDREPVHIPGRSQDYGALVIVSLQTAQILSASENSDQMLGIAADELVGQPIGAVFPVLQDAVAVLSGMKEGKRGDRRELMLPGGVSSVTFHHCDGVVLFEFEPIPGEQVPDGSSMIGQMFMEMDGRPMQKVYETVVRRIRQLSGFDRVMLYQFYEDGHGSVVAEAKTDQQEAFLGLHYPATDIPVPARRLYELNWIRTIADVGSDGVAMHPAVDPETKRPWNMSFTALRAISPIHLEYLRNMQVGASMSISVMNGQRLWGLIACHHDSPRIVSAGMRDSCELAGSLLSAYLTSRHQQAVLDRQVSVGDTMASQLTVMASGDQLVDGLRRTAAALAAILDADGLAWRSGEQSFQWGLVPTPAGQDQVFAALADGNSDPVSWTDDIHKWLPTIGDQAERCAGLLAIRIGHREKSTLVFFRRPYVDTITWAGNPDKSVTEESGRLTPRKSFAAFRQQVGHKSKVWSKADRETARSLGNGLRTVLVEHAARLSEINEELRQLNADLDAFTYAASHDLKEPLRGILHFTNLLERAGSIGDQHYTEGVDGLKRIVARMSELLDGLRRFSRVGRSDLAIETFSLREAVAQATDMLFAGDRANNVNVIVDGDTQMQGDFACVREVLGNLISNAVKYNASESKQVTIGVAPVVETPLADRFDPTTEAIYVRDNGIGIDPQHFQTIFDIFYRLHDRDQYGGGSGAGLTIVRRIVERHGGAITVQSDGTGTVFYFTLGESEQ